MYACFLYKFWRNFWNENIFLKKCSAVKQIITSYSQKKQFTGTLNKIILFQTFRKIFLLLLLWSIIKQNISTQWNIYKKLSLIKCVYGMIYNPFMIIFVYSCSLIFSTIRVMKLAKTSWRLVPEAITSSWFAK